MALYYNLQGRVGQRQQQRAATPNFSRVIAQMQASQASAQRANIQRYQQGLATLKGGYATAMQRAQQFGTTALQEVEESAGQQKATGEQELVSRGLGGTTIRGAMTRGVERERLSGRARIGEQRSMLLGQLAQQRARDISGFIERRADVGPDMSMFASLLQTAGQQQQRPRATITRMGPMAAAGRTVFGQPFKY